MRSGRDGPAPVQHHDAVRIHHRRKAVRDHDGGAAARKPVQRVLDQPLVFRVERARRLVQQQHGRVAEDGAGDGEALALAGGEAHAAFAEIAVIALRERAEELVRRRRFRRLDDLRMAGVGPSVGDVLPRRGREHDRLLRHKAELRPHRRRGGAADIDAVQRYPPAHRVVEAQQQVEERRFPRSRRPDHGHGLARRNVEVEPAEDRPVRRGGIGEGRPLEGHGAARGLGQRRRIGGRGDLGARGQQVHQPLRRPGRALEVAHDLAERAERRGRHHGIEDEGREVARRHGARHHVPAAEPEDRTDRPQRQHDHDDGERRAHAGAPDGGAERLFHPHGEIDDIHALMAEGLHGADGGDRFLDMRAHIRHPVLRCAGEAAQPPAQHHDRQQHQRDDQHHQPGEPRAGDEQHGRSADEQQHVPERHRDRRADDGLDQRGIRGQPGQDFARLGDLEETRAELQDMGEHVAAQVRHHPLPDPGDQIGAEEGRRREHHDDAEQDDEGGVQHGGIVAGDAVIDEMAQPEADAEHRARRDYERDGGPGGLPPVRHEIARQRTQGAQVAGGLSGGYGRVRSSHCLFSVTAQRRVIAAPPSRV